MSSPIGPVAPEKGGDEKNTNLHSLDVVDPDIITASPIHTDVALGLYKESFTLDFDRRELVAAKVRRKLDFILLPMESNLQSMCWVYFMQFLDKQTLNYSSAYGLQQDLNLVGRDYSWVAALTNIGYLACAYPSTIALQKLPIGKFVTVMVMVWGAVLMLTCAVHNFAGIAAIRFILGGTEACIGPAWISLTTMFWTREEAPLRMSCWLGMNGLSSLAGAGISWGIGTIDHPAIATWKLVFLVIGAMSFVSGAGLFFILPSTPNDVRFFSHEEKVVSVWRIASNRTGVKHSKILWYQIWECLGDPKVYCIALQALCLGILNGSVTNFMSILLKGFGYDSLKSVQYQMPSGAIQFVCNISAGIFVSKVPNTLVLTIILGFIPGICGMIGIATIDLKHQLSLTACSWLQGIFGVSIILTWDLVGANIAGHTKRTTVNGVEFCFYAAGAIIGPFLFLPQEAPRYITAIKTLCGIYGAAIFFTAIIGVLMVMENRRRSGLELAEEVADEQGFTDRTDLENKGFTYKL
ncbi:MFS transporter [Rhizodiscina lignyota]|uniref:MFS transporter n=1 Tax=Rhizodiscina lignyota TaxID=1504668 RepID=A0A9P4M9T1_9PEZI|nr:MFS transporter [Rhizodiscina lignyota]